MASLNKVMLIGHLGRDPEMRRTQNGKNVTNFTMATSERWNNEDRVEWHRIVLFDRLAEVAKDYLRKGSQIYIEGRIQTKSWEDQTGAKRSSVEIVGSNLVILSTKRENQGYANQSSNNNSSQGNDNPEGPGPSERAQELQAPVETSPEPRPTTPAPVAERVDAFPDEPPPPTDADLPF
ncbi:MAG: single-stranded DNA-binding protein [Deltaproteobacteria bacterium]|jgi:single-strand DNA-binding protein|nr:single-stranded DNA-binding protein [Deltaproteobacteria bacterium]